MLEWHEIEVHQLGSWPNFPVCGYNIQIVSLQIFLYILEEDNGLKWEVHKNNGVRVDQKSFHKQNTMVIIKVGFSIT